MTGPRAVALVWDADTVGAQLPLGSRVPVRVKISRSPLAAGNVRLSLLSSQIPAQERNSRPEQSEATSDDADRTLRFDGMPTIAGDKNEIVATIIVPTDLASIPYDLAVEAELLAADGKTVSAKANAPARRFTTIQPLKG